MQSGYIRHPDAFNPTAYSQTNDRTHTSAPGHFSVTASSHPILFEVFETISADNCGGAGHSSYSVPDSLRDRAARAEAVLGRLSADERDTVAAGDQDDAATILGDRCPDVAEREDLDGFLNAFFEDWHGTE